MPDARDRSSHVFARLPFARLSAAARGRLSLAAGLVGGSIALDALLRVALLARHAPPALEAPAVVALLGLGGSLDALVATVVAAPALLALAAFRLQVLERPFVRGAVLATAFSVQAFLSVVELVYFEEFDARFNRIALDYVLFPHEVFVNVWESYPVAWVAAASVAAGIAMAAVVVRATRGLTIGPWPWAARGSASAAAVAAVALAVLGLRSLPAAAGPDRVAAEIARNGLHELVRAWTTADVDYELYYRTLPRPEAHARAERVLASAESPAPSATAAGPSAEPRADARPWDVVIVLEESFGSEFVGALGHEDRGLTPGFDRWSREGLLLANLVPTGNRTVRGLEGTLCSFVPLPGDAIIKRDGLAVPTLASVLGGQGWTTAFFYGGIGFFDDMKPFLTTHGFEEFVEQGDYPDGAFATAWGVADEHVFDALVERQLAAAARRERLFATVLTVSNHRPYDVPPGRIDCAEERSRRCAVRYADWALARYLDRSRAEGLLDHTVVLVLGDHGARVYGSPRLPAASYRVPGLLLVPDARWRGRRIERLCSQIDMAPTLMALLGVTTEVPFMGRDVTAPLPDDGGRAFVQHNRDVGLLTDTELVVLGLRSSAEYYRRPGRGSDDLVVAAPDDRLRELEKDAIAVFQTAHDVVRGRTEPPARRVMPR